MAVGEIRRIGDYWRIIINIKERTVWEWKVGDGSCHWVERFSVQGIGGMKEDEATDELRGGSFSIYLFLMPMGTLGSQATLPDTAGSRSEISSTWHVRDPRKRGRPGAMGGTVIYIQEATAEGTRTIEGQCERRI